jgi:hypothetical protein
MDLKNQAKQYAPQSAGDGVEALARAGYAAKGFVYIVLGVLSLQAAISGGSTTGGQGAVYAIADQPFGSVLLVLLAIGLAGYAVWRGVQAVLDPEHKGDDAKGFTKRVGYAFSGLSHAALCVMAVQLVTGGGGGGGGGQSRTSYLADVMENSVGQVVVGLLGVFVIAAGIHQLYKAKTTKFRQELETGSMSASTERLATVTGRVGLAARGVVFPIMGIYLIKAALTADASQAKGVGGALAAISSSPFGTAMLAVVAAGLVAYGVYQLMAARYRKIPAPG